MRRVAKARARVTARGSPAIRSEILVLLPPRLLQIRLTFGDSDDNNGDRNNENLDEVLSLLVGSAVGLASEVNEEAAREGMSVGLLATRDAAKNSPNHERGEEDETGGRSELGDELGESVELELEGSVLGIALECCGRGGKISE
jgi:hypothetical protein